MSTYDDEIKLMPPGLDRAVLRALSFHVGREKAIGRDDLVEACGRVGFKSTERQVRETIKQLRREGHLICSAPSINGGYWLANNRLEYNAFRKTEYRAKILDMEETLKAMDASADSQFGQDTQPNLF